jgi:hypothetical protein
MLQNCLVISIKNDFPKNNKKQNQNVQKKKENKLLLFN